MLNPSTADALVNDPTIERCQKRAEQLNFGALEVVNLFAWRSTDPSVLANLEDPIGPENDDAIRDAARRAALLIVGWGKEGSLLNRGPEVMQIIRETGTVPHALKLNTDKSPQHPLYISYLQQPFPI
jgi:hypothetical protein